MDTRRDFLKKAMMVSGGTALLSTLPPAIQRALAIEPAAGSTYLDAEHIVLLMQENRSFDHTYGTLSGVRGFNDPRAVMLPNRHSVWLQTNEAGETYAPFRLDIKDSKITWMGSLPHGRQSQVDASNGGRHDKWLEAKKSGEAEYENMPLTMGYYTREDIPFYYALADAFTICDQNFCSSLTGTDPNRLYFWSGTIREKPHDSSHPFVQNGDVENGVEWETFPEVLEKNAISWKVYQNELGIETGLSNEEEGWLSNFGDNPLEYFNQYKVKLADRYINFLPKKITGLEKEIAELQQKAKAVQAASKASDEIQKSLTEKTNALNNAKAEQKTWTRDKFQSLADHEKNIHTKAFVTNTADPHQHQLTPLDYNDESNGRRINIPKGDVLHQFRADVEQGSLPTVSWLVAPENFSDHPSAPWFGSWYLSEAMDILTKNPEVWKKTIFILAYDENDGYFDHVPPFLAPDPHKLNSGAASDGIDTSIEHVRLEKDAPASIGLGYRVPLVVASPWTRGGWVNSQVFDHTSTLQFLEGFLSKKFNKKIEQQSISSWRRTICGDLTSVFHESEPDKAAQLPFLKKDPFIESIYNAKFKTAPTGFKPLSKEEIARFNAELLTGTGKSYQETGTRPSCALPYELYSECVINPDKTINVILAAANALFKEHSAGAPFHIYAPAGYKTDSFAHFSYGVRAGDKLIPTFNIADFPDRKWWLQVYGPNGFFRDFRGTSEKSDVSISLQNQYGGSLASKLTGNLIASIKNQSKDHSVDITIKHHGYKLKNQELRVQPGETAKYTVESKDSSGWYDFSVLVKTDTEFLQRFAGRIETGLHGITDPVMGCTI